ncbi:DUF6712 family protein [Larkinella arboricola]
MLITNTAQIKEFAGGIQTTLNFEIIRPHVDRAETIVVGTMVGRDFLLALAQDNLTVPMSEALHHTRRAIALTALHESMVSAMYQYGNSGISRFLPKDSEKLSMWEVDIILADAAKKADEAIEQLMAFLDASAYKLPAWRATTAYQERWRNLIPSTELFARALPEACMTYRLFAVLKMYMPSTEKKHIEGVLGRALLVDLKEKLAGAGASDADGLTREEGELWQLCREMLAPLTLWIALPFIQVRFFPDGVRMIQAFKGLKDEKAVDNDQVEKLRAELYTRAVEAKGALKRFLNQTASEFIFPDYFHSSLYVAPGSNGWRLPDNEGKKHFRL